jgi:hypothetical protein
MHIVQFKPLWKMVFTENVVSKTAVVSKSAYEAKPTVVAGIV